MKQPVVIQSLVWAIQIPQVKSIIFSLVNCRITDRSRQIGPMIQVSQQVAAMTP